MIRKATIKDLKAIQSLRRQLLKETKRKRTNSDNIMQLYMKSESSIFYIAEKEKPIGFIHAFEDYIQNLYVIPNERNKGIGTKLLSSLPKRNYRVTTDSPGFYIKNGFKKLKGSVYFKPQDLYPFLQ